METPQVIDIEQVNNIESDIDKAVSPTSDEEIVFDPIKDMWVTVKVERNIEEAGDDNQFWVWEVNQL